MASLADAAAILFCDQTWGSLSSQSAWFARHSSLNGEFLIIQINGSILAFYDSFKPHRIENIQTRRRHDPKRQEQRIQCPKLWIGPVVHCAVPEEWRQHWPGDNETPEGDMFVDHVQGAFWLFNQNQHKSQIDKGRGQLSEQSATDEPHCTWVRFMWRCGTRPRTSIEGIKSTLTGKSYEVSVWKKQT